MVTYWPQPWLRTSFYSLVAYALIGRTMKLSLNGTMMVCLIELGIGYRFHGEEQQIQ